MSGAQVQSQDDVPNPAAYKFSDDELLALKECSKESLYYRCIPFGLVSGGLAYAAVTKGFLKGSPKYGAVPKVLMAVGLGYILGKFSYKSNCEEKIMALPNSELAQIIRQRKGRPLWPRNVPDASSDSSAAEDSQSESLVQEMRAQDFTYGAPPTASGLDDSFRPSMDSFTVSEQPLPPVSQNVTSYEELRNENRREYMMGTLEKQVKSSAPAVSIPTSRSSAVPKSKNAYGDVWEE